MGQLEAVQRGGLWNGRGDDRFVADRGRAGIVELSFLDGALGRVVG